MTKLSHYHAGMAGEEIACAYLTEQGYTILERNWRRKGGEIDIIAEKSPYLVFAEVKTRTAGPVRSRYGRPGDAVNAAKRAHLLDVVHKYLHEHRPQARPRIDIIEIVNTPLPDGSLHTAIRHLKAAVSDRSYDEQDQQYN